MQQHEIIIVYALMVRNGYAIGKLKLTFVILIYVYYSAK